MRPHEVIEQLQNTNSRNEKEEIISQAWENGCVEFFEGVKLAYDSLKPFHVKQVPKIESDENEEDFQPDFDWNEFKQLAEKLHRRELTGHDARDALHDAAQRADVNEWNMFMRRVLLKDLRAGIKETTTDKPVIMLTGFGDMMDAADDKPETVDRLISKPVTVTKLREILTDVLT